VAYMLDMFFDSGLQSCPSWAVGRDASDDASGPC